MKNKYLLILTRTLPYILIVAYIAGLLGSIAIERYNFAINGSMLAVPAIAAAIALRHIYRLDPDSLSGSISLFPFEQRMLTPLFGIVFSLTVVLGLLCPIKSPYFLGGIITLYTIILLQIFSKGYRPTVMLIEIVLTMACLIYETTMKSPYYFGGTDIPPHIFMSTVTYLSGHIIPPDLTIEYAYFPLYHIWIALSSYVLAIDIKTALFLITCPAYVIVTIFLYLLFKRVTGDIQISLLAALLYSIDSIVTYYGVYMITRVAAYVGFIILLYLLIFRENRSNLYKKSTRIHILAVLAIVYILLVHQVSGVQILFLLLLLLGCERFIGSGRHFQISFFIFEVILFLAYWFYMAFDFSRGVVVSRLRPDFFEAPAVIENLQPYSPFTFLFDHVSALIFLFFAIIGIGYLLWRQKPAFASVFGLFALLTIVLYVPTPIHALWQTMNLLRFDRFMLLISPFMAFIMGWGLYIVSGYLQKRIPIRAARLIVLLLFVVYCCGAAGVIKAEEDPGSRKSFYFEELLGFDHIYSHVPYGSIIYSDYFTSRYFRQSYFSGSDDLGLPFYRSQTIREVTDIPSYQGFMVITHNQFMIHGLKFEKGGEFDPDGWLYAYLPSSETIPTLSNNLEGKDKVYSSKFVDLYHS